MYFSKYIQDHHPSPRGHDCRDVGPAEGLPPQVPGSVFINSTWRRTTRGEDQLTHAQKTKFWRKNRKNWRESVKGPAKNRTP